MKVIRLGHLSLSTVHPCAKKLTHPTRLRVLIESVLKLLTKSFRKMNKFITL